MKETADNIDAEFLKRVLDLKTTCQDTETQKKLHNIDVCIVQYQSEGYIMGNPVHWCGADYYISDMFEKDGVIPDRPVRLKIFVGCC